MKKKKRLIVSAIGNFLADAVREKGRITDEFGVVDREGSNEDVKKTIKTFMKIPRSSAEKFCNTKFAMVTPILSPRHQWYTDNFEQMNRMFNEGLKGIR
jgi:hypothetical protein